MEKKILKILSLTFFYQFCWFPNTNIFPFLRRHPHWSNAIYCIFFVKLKVHRDTRNKLGFQVLDKHINEINKLKTFRFGFYMLFHCATLPYEFDDRIDFWQNRNCSQYQEKTSKKNRQKLSYFTLIALISRFLLHNRPSAYTTAYLILGMFFHASSFLFTFLKTCT